MHNVGYDTYCKLLARAISEARGEPVKHEIETTVDVPLTAHIPDGYIPSREQKVQAYRRVADIATEEDARQVLLELSDRYGKAPQQVEDLVRISLVRALANRIGASSVIVRGDLTRVRFDAGAQPDMDALMAAMRQYGAGAQMTRGAVPGLALRGTGDVRRMLDAVLAFLRTAGGDCAGTADTV